MTRHKTHVRKLTDEFRTSHPFYEELSDRVEQLVAELLSSANLRVHSVSCRAKTPESLHQKISEEGGRYRRLSDITDLAGVRIITYFATDVDAVARLIEAEFEVDRPNSVDK